MAFDATRNLGVAFSFEFLYCSRRRLACPAASVSIRFPKKLSSKVRLLRNSRGKNKTRKIMNSSPIRGIRRKKSLLSEIKVLVVGAPGVGKSGH